MTIIFVVLFGTLTGLLANGIKKSRFGLWWDIYLGIAGSTFASLIMIYGYLMNVFHKHNIIGLNFYSISVDIAGAAILLYTARIPLIYGITKPIITKGRNI